MKTRAMLKVGDRVLLETAPGLDKLGLVVKDNGLSCDVQLDDLPSGHTLVASSWEISRAPEDAPDLPQWRAPSGFVPRRRRTKVFRPLNQPAVDAPRFWLGRRGRGWDSDPRSGIER
jgi:hypothetical protein